MNDLLNNNNVRENQKEPIYMSKESSVNPKVFISYSWAVKERVIELAHRLVNDGIDVSIDVWDLQPGQDVNYFIEQCVVDLTINKVLMICDKTYAEKADGREGGVGKETRVISPQVYGKATEYKFIPVIFEYNEQGDPYTPVYLKSSFYIDLSADDEKYETEYEKLIRHLYQKPEYKKPPLGNRPGWLDDDGVNLINIRTAIQQINSIDGKNQNKLLFIIQKFNSDFIDALKEYMPVNNENYYINFIRQYEATKYLRDLYLDYVEELIKTDINTGSILGDFFESVYNETYTDNDRNSNNDSSNDSEFYFVFIWEMFISTVAVLLHFERYKEIHSLLNRTYFLNTSSSGLENQEYAFVKFRRHCKFFDSIINQQNNGSNKITPTGDLIVKREKKPIITSNSLANADIVLYQLSTIYDIVKILSPYHHYWFPTLYVYYGEYKKQEIWRRMRSKEHCEKLFALFGVSKLFDFLEKIQKNEEDRSMSYRGCFNHVQHILWGIDINDIGKLP